MAVVHHATASVVGLCALHRLHRREVSLLEVKELADAIQCGSPDVDAPTPTTAQVHQLLVLSQERPHVPDPSSAGGIPDTPLVSPLNDEGRIMGVGIVYHHGEHSCRRHLRLAHVDLELTSGFAHVEQSEI